MQGGVITFGLLPQALGAPRLVLVAVLEGLKVLSLFGF